MLLWGVNSKLPGNFILLISSLLISTSSAISYLPSTLSELDPDIISISIGFCTPLICNVNNSIFFQLSLNNHTARAAILSARLFTRTKTKDQIKYDHSLVLTGKAIRYTIKNLHSKVYVIPTRLVLKLCETTRKGFIKICRKTKDKISENITGDFPTQWRTLLDRAT